MQGHNPAPDHNVPRVIETGVRIGVGYEYHTNAPSVCGTCHLWLGHGEQIHMQCGTCHLYHGE